MRKPGNLSLLLILFVALPLSAQWSNVAPGVDYRHFAGEGRDIHVTRVDLTEPRIRVIVTPEAEKATRVSDFAKRTSAIVAINGDYFDEQFNPIGLTLGACGEWKSSRRTKREAYVGVGSGRARVTRQADTTIDQHAEGWMNAAISGWPALVASCTPLTAGQLPGSDAFTRAPHPRTAAGVSRDGSTLYLVVADGRRTGVPGLTLAELAEFMSSTLDACSAVNFDGGGSAAMWVGDRIVNRPADGVERRVANHLAVIPSDAVLVCEEPQSPVAAGAKKRGGSTTTTTTQTTTQTTIRSTTTTAPPPEKPRPPRY